MILSITLNPALDVSGVVPALIPNEKTYVSHETRLAGGNGINAARIAYRLGADVLASGLLGGSSGEELKRLLADENIPQEFISIQGRTRTNITISLEEGHQQTRLSFPGPRIRKVELKALHDLINRIRPALLIIGGSLPQGVSSSFIKKLVRENNRLGVITFVDVPGKVLKDVIDSNPFFIKPNLTEYQEMTGKKMSRLNEVLKIARKLATSIPLQCISSVEGGALLVTSEHAWFGKTPKLKVMSTVGAGDSMVGAMAHSLIKLGGVLDETTCEKMLRLGLAASSATLSNKGLTMGTRSGIKAFVPDVIIRQVD